MCSKHVQAWNKLTVKQKFCASSWLITETKKKLPVGSTPPLPEIFKEIAGSLKEVEFLEQLPTVHGRDRRLLYWHYYMYDSNHKEALPVTDYRLYTNNF